tara:strand:- start:60 stop:464 length:405 start_codon:yes stop_codon:yes gene_type:complete
MENQNITEYYYHSENYQFWFEYKGERYSFDPHFDMPTFEEMTGSPAPEGFENPDAGKRLMNVLGMSEEEAQQAVIEGKWNQARGHRDRILKQIDWTQGADVPENIKSKYSVFRQALRDITSQSDPENITWPDEP